MSEQEIQEFNELQLQDLEDAASESPPTAKSENSPSEGFAIPLVLVAIGCYLTYGLVTMEVPESASWPGPRMFPTIVTVLLFVVASCMGIQAIRGYLKQKTTDPQSKKHNLDWTAVLIVAATFLVFALILIPLGWILSGALLFWGVAVGLGSRSWLKDALISLAVSSLVQVAFSAGLGLNLPSGILGWF